jgi:hypothetical protein
MAELRDELGEDVVHWPAVLRTLGALACRGQKDVACAYVRAHFPAHPSGALEKVIEDLENEDIGDRIGQELADAYHEARGWRTCDCDDIPSDDRPCPPCRVRRDADATEALNASAIAGQVPFRAPGGAPRRGARRQGAGRGIATAVLNALAGTSVVNSVRTGAALFRVAEHDKGEEGGDGED